MRNNGERRGLFYRWFAAFMAHATPAHERLVADQKRRLLSNVHGTVLEIGPGTGPNLKFFPQDIRWIGIEPNLHMHRYLRKEAKQLGLAIDLHPGVAEKMKVENDCIDVVVSTLVLCSVSDLEATLREILRVLKPGGRLVFIEHVAAPRNSFLHLVQRLLRPAWRQLGDGCHPDRETWRAIETAGFEQVDYQRLRVPLPVIKPHIAGTAVKSGRVADQDPARKETIS